MRIFKGIFSGVEGTVIARRGSDRLVIAVELIEDGVTIEVDSGLVQWLEMRGPTGFHG